MSNAAKEDLVPCTQVAPGEDHCGLSRRSVLKSATVAVSAMSGVSSALADTPAPASFGAPLVELHVPAGVLTLEQKETAISTCVLRNNIVICPDDCAGQQPDLRTNCIAQQL